MLFIQVEKISCKNYLDVGIDIQKVQKQGKAANALEDCPTVETWWKRTRDKNYLASAACD